MGINPQDCKSNSANLDSAVEKNDCEKSNEKKDKKDPVLDSVGMSSDPNDWTPAQGPHPSD